MASAAPARIGERPADARLTGLVRRIGARLARVAGLRARVGRALTGTSPRQILRSQVRIDPTGMPLACELHDPDTHVVEGVAALRGHRREEADRGEPRD